jgi:drug/metabolite transporter superfamily protein YnfA
VLAGLYEIGGGYLVWGWMREHKPLAWALIGALILAAYGVVAAPCSRYDLLGAVVGAWSWSLPLEVSVPLFYGPRGGIILRNPLRSSAL